MDLGLGIGGIVIAFAGVSANVLGIRVRVDRSILPTLPKLPLLGRLFNWLIARGQSTLVGNEHSQGFKFGFVFGAGTVAMVVGIAAAVIFLSSAMAEDEADVRILSPSAGQAVPHEIYVEGNAREREDGEFLVVFVRPKPDDPLQDYHAQTSPQQTDGGRWRATPVYVGVPDDEPGTLFKICAVITRSQISAGDRLRMLPPDPCDCVLVTRE
jgi:hypothetical protein